MVGGHASRIKKGVEGVNKKGILASNSLLLTLSTAFIQCTTHLPSKSVLTSSILKSRKNWIPSYLSKFRQSYYTKNRTSCLERKSPLLGMQRISTFLHTQSLISDALTCTCTSKIMILYSSTMKTYMLVCYDLA